MKRLKQFIKCWKCRHQDYIMVRHYYAFVMEMYDAPRMTLWDIIVDWYNYHIHEIFGICVNCDKE